MAGLLYYPVEHLYLAGDFKLVNFSAKTTARLSDVSVCLWLLSLAISALNSLSIILKLTKKRLTRERLRVYYQREEESGVGPVLWAPPPCSEQDLSPTVLGLIETTCNLIMGVGFLSQGRLPRYAIGLLGVVSSIIGLYRYLGTMN